jgi:hypothetical protein
MTNQQKSMLARRAACDEQRQIMQDQLDLEAAGSKGNYPGPLKANLQRWLDANCGPDQLGGDGQDASPAQ